MTSFAAMDRGLHGAQAKLTGGISPIAIGTALFDWSAHFANAPFRQVELALDALTRMSRLGAAALGGDRCEIGRKNHDRPKRVGGNAGRSFQGGGP